MAHIIILGYNECRGFLSYLGDTVGYGSIPFCLAFTNLGCIMHHKDVIRYCATAYLHIIRDMEARITALEDRVIQISSELELTGLGYDIAVMTSPSDGKIPDGVAALIKARDEWEAMVNLTYEEINNAKKICTPLNTPRWAAWLHYKEGRTWAKVGRLIGYSERQSRRIADNGIVQIYYLMPEQYRRYTIADAIPGKMDSHGQQ